MGTGGELFIYQSVRHIVLHFHWETCYRQGFRCAMPSNYSMGAIYQSFAS